MISNIPAFTGQQDFQARHSDMLAAARCEPLTKREIEEERFISVLIASPRAVRAYMDVQAIDWREMAAAKARAWETIRERLEQCEVQRFIGIDMAKPGSDRTVIVRRLISGNPYAD